MYPTNVVITQHAVGQGGMLSGYINNSQSNLHWLYDCGSSSHAKRCKDEILQIKSRGKVDFLFLSHLHNDHINETKYLIKNCNVQEVVLPFLNQHLKNIKLIEAAVNNGLTEDYINYVVSPEVWLTEQGVNSISYIMPITPEDELEPLTIADSPIGEGPTWDGETAPFEAENVKLFKPHSKLITPIDNGIWILAPFAFSVSDAFVLNFLNEFKKETGIDPKSNQFKQDLLNLAHDTSKLNDLKILYDKYWKNHNTVSMTLFMGANNGSLIRVKSDNFNYRSYFYKCMLIKYLEKIDWLDKCGWIATGDINVKDDKCRNAFIKYYHNYITYTGVFSVPHHGSRRNWDASLCQLFANSHFLIEASKNNTYGHPSGHVLHDIVSNCLTYSWVSEERQSSFICEYILH